MKVWQSYGSEHSSNILVIGRFKTEADARKAERIIEEVTKIASEKLDFSNRARSRMPEDTWEALRDLNCYFLSPPDFDDFLFDGYVTRDEETITISTEEYDLNAFLKVMIHYGAKVEMFSRHDYPDEEESK